jgi:FMN phosphatase YigB (HAD superfamily)
MKNKMTEEKQDVYIVDLMDTLVWSPNLIKILATDNPELFENFKKDPKKYQKEVAQKAEAYLLDNRVELRVFEDTIPALERLREQGRVFVLSNGTRKTIQDILAKTGLEGYVSGSFSADEIGADKSDERLYKGLSERLGKDSRLVAYVDDKDKYCIAASQSGVFGQVCQISRDKERESQGAYRVIKSLEEIV